MWITIFEGFDRAWFVLQQTSMDTRKFVCMKLRMHLDSLTCFR